MIYQRTSFIAIHLCAVILCMVLFLTISPPEVMAQITAKTVTVRVDGIPIPSEVPPLVLDGRVLLPLRAVADSLGIQVVWDPTHQTVTVVDGPRIIKLRVAQRFASIDGQSVRLETPPSMHKGRLFIPLRLVGEALGCAFEWNPITSSVAVTSPLRSMQVLGFYALGDVQTSSWTNLFDQVYPAFGSGHTNAVSSLALGWYSIDAQGTLLTKSRTGWQRPDSYETVLEVAQTFQLQCDMVIHVTDQDGTISTFLADDSALNRAVQQITAEASRYDGVNLNFEGLGLTDKGIRLQQTRDQFSHFVRILSDGLHTSNKKLTLTLHAPNSAYHGYDYAALGKSADRIVIMAYDYGPKPEPIDLVLGAVAMAKKVVPPGKLLLGISVPNEDAHSIAMKIGIAKRYHLGGIALWRLGLISDDIWKTLGNGIHATKGTP